MDNKHIKLTLIHAEWCPHCKNLVEEYGKMRNNKKACNMMSFIDYEESELGNAPEEDLTINGEEFAGFPTLKIDIFNREYLYDGERTEENIYNFIYEKLKEQVN